MRIGSLQLFRQGVGDILDQRTRLATTQNQLAVGKRIVNPSDDPTGSAQLIGLSETAKTTEQFQRNISAARSRLELQDGALSSVGDALQRIRELTVSALNDTKGADERTGIAAEIRQLGDEIMGLANRKDGNGQYMFAGYQVLTVPFSETTPGVFSYDGDLGQRHIQIGPARQVADGDSGQAVFMDIADGAGGFEDIFTTLENLATSLEANAPNNASLDQLDRAMDHLLGFRATAGARLNALESQQNINAALLVQLEQTRSTIEDLDYAEAAARLGQESVILQAAQQAFIKVQNLNLFNFM